MRLTGQRVVLNLSNTAMQHVEPGDFISHLRTFQGGLELARVAGKVSPAYTVIASGPDVVPDFYKFVFKSPAYVSQIASITDQLRDGQSMRFPELNQTWLPAPPPREQRAIADYLDQETAEIDAFIGDLDAMTELSLDRMASLRSALAQQPSVEDDSQETVSLTRALPHRVDYRGATPPKSDEGMQLITAGNVRPGHIDYVDPCEYVSLDDYAAVMRRGKPQVGDILFTMEAPLGNAAIVDRDDIALAQRVIKFRARPGVLPEFAVLAMNSSEFQSQLAVRATGSTALGLKASKLSELRLHIPQLEIQQAAVREWDEAELRERKLLRDADRAVDLARERRAALISAAVTGQIDVTQKHRPVAEQLENEVTQLS